MVHVVGVTAVPPQRDTIRCAHCTLMQFVTESGNCRKCGKQLLTTATAAPAQQPEAVLTSTGERYQDINALPLLEALPKRLRLARKLRNLSQKQLADRMGLPRTYVSKLENGKATPTLTSLTKIAKALGSTPSLLLSEDFVIMDPGLLELARVARQLNHAERETILQHARSLVAVRGNA